ncbi:MAG: hypothetical protein BKP49_00610 [Treponema sp. CETP13]|nr:MAG: hypothetical protein BKP49_00610 [Treponema sp. CETP13]
MNNSNKVTCKKSFLYTGFFIFLIITTGFAVSTTFISCNKNGASNYLELEKNVKNPTTIEEYENAIAAHDDRIQEIIDIESKTGVWYKILGSKYLDKKMYGKALESFKMAIQYYPDNANLYYYVGVCAGYMAKASLDFDANGSNSIQKNYLALAESSYLQAIQFNPSYTRALYAIGVLYVFELNKPQLAISYLNRLLTVESKNLDGMMVLARAYYVTGDNDKAVAMYDSVIKETSDANRKTEAENNKRIVLDQAYNN